MMLTYLKVPITCLENGSYSSFLVNKQSRTCKLKANYSQIQSRRYLTSHRVSGMPLMVRNNNCYTAVIGEDKLTIPVIIAVGNQPTAVFCVLSMVASLCNNLKIYTSQCTFVPFFFVSFFHTSLDTIFNAHISPILIPV